MDIILTAGAIPLFLGQEVWEQESRDVVSLFVVAFLC